MTKPTLHGPGFSTYVRSVRLALAEKGVDYEHHEFNFLEGWPEGYEKRHPFKKVPAFSHDGLDLFETQAILSYIDEAFDGPALQPAGAGERARMRQVLCVVDNYAYGALITRTFIPRAVVPMIGGQTDESVIAGAKADAELSLQVLNGLLGTASWFVGETCSLADLHVLPVLHYAAQIPEGQAMLRSAPVLSSWLAAMQERDSVKATVPQLG